MKKMKSENPSLGPQHLKKPVQPLSERFFPRSLAARCFPSDSEVLDNPPAVRKKGGALLRLYPQGKSSGEFVSSLF
jgi:hypothetical protein